MKETIKVIIVDDHEIFRNGLRMVINNLNHSKVIAEASNGQEFINLIDKEKPDVVLMDIEMPVMNGIEATRLALEKYPDIKIAALTMFNDDAYIDSMIKSGVKGFLLKNISRKDLDRALISIYNGHAFFSNELWDYFTKKAALENKSPKDKLQLTNREKEILQLLAEGLSNKEIAKNLFVSERTIVGHKSNLLAKTNCKNTISLLSYSIKNKLVNI
ncbi:MAG: response regulator transcription factor [Bacteroidetes bacterium]|nr:response regulator transcription factor [Bacteroidota bacterium]